MCKYASIAVYFIIKYLLKRTVGSEQLGWQYVFLHIKYIDCVI
jgi:hypothetical protein